MFFNVTVVLLFLEAEVTAALVCTTPCSLGISLLVDTFVTVGRLFTEDYFN